MPGIVDDAPGQRRQLRGESGEAEEQQQRQGQQDRIDPLGGRAGCCKGTPRHARHQLPDAPPPPD